MISADIAKLSILFSRTQIEKFIAEFDTLELLLVSSQPDKISTKLHVLTELESVEKYITFLDPEWPEILDHVTPRCSCVFYEGDIALLNSSRILGVVGSRTVTHYAQNTLQTILSPLLNTGLVTISGLAFGIDTIMHSLAIKHHAPTIAVIGGGLDQAHFYPKEHWPIRTKILDQGGLILSEYPRGTKPQSYHFPTRNRLIAALASHVWIVQASFKSGTLITAELALQLDKDVLTIPAELTNSHFEGNIKLLQNGAQLIASTDDLAQYIGVSLTKKPITTAHDNPILAALSIDPASTEDLAEQLQMPATTLLTELTMLELSGKVWRDGIFWTLL